MANNKFIYKTYGNSYNRALLTEKFLKSQIDLIFKEISNYPDDVRCKKCLIVFYWNGCPHCGNTFLKREVLKQTF